MTSQARIEANRKNARKSTGPRSDEGKRRSSMNAIKHGIPGNDLPRPNEDQGAFDRRMIQWVQNFQPRSDEEVFCAGKP